MSWPWDRVPPWAASLLNQPLNEMAERLRKPEFVQDVKQRLDQVIADLPNVAARKVDQVVRTAKRATDSVQRWAADRNAPAVKIVNASGLLFPARAESAPVCGEVAIAWSAAAHAWSEQATDSLSRAERAAQVRASELVNLSLRVAATWPSGVVAATHCGPAPLMVPRWAAMPLGAAGAFPDVLRASGREIHEFGAAHLSGTAFTIDATSHSGTVVLWSHGELDTLSQLKQPALAKLTKIVVAPYVWPCDPKLTAIGEPQTLAHLFAAGADIVVVPGNGLWGGPQCGLLFGTEERLQALDRSLYWKTVRADAGTHAAVAAALEIWAEGTAIQRMPALTALASSLDNLRFRANQLMTRLAVVEGLEITTIENHSKIWTHGPDLPSVQLCLRRSGHASATWAESLAQGIPAVWATCTEDRLCLDLRTIDPALEGTLCEMLGGH